MQNNDAISNITLEVLRGKLNPARQKNGTLYSRDSDFGYAKGSYYDRVVELYKVTSPDTLMHELSHDFFKTYFDLTEKYGLTERNKVR